MKLPSSASFESVSLISAASTDVEIEPYPGYMQPIGVVPATAEGASRKSAFFNVSNCAVGAGILSLPFAFDSMGLVQGVLIFATFAVVTCLTLQILPMCCQAAGTSSYEDTVEAAFGKRVKQVFQLIVILYSCGVIVGYIVIIGDLLPPIFAAWAKETYPSKLWYFSPRFYQVLITTLILFPLSCFKRLDSLKFASMFAIAAVLYFTILVIVETFIDLDRYRERGQVASSGETIKDTIVWWNWSSDIFLGIPIMAFAFGGHLQAISIFSELKKPFQTQEDWSVIAVAAVLLLSTIYMIVGGLSYLRFMPGDNGNVLQQMLAIEPNNIAIQLASLAMSIVVILSFPLFTWPIRFSLDRLLFSSKVSFYDASPEASSFRTSVRYYVMTALIVFSCLFVATLLGKLEAVFGLTGATGGVLIKFLFPVGLYWKLGPVYRQRFLDSPGPLPKWQKSICIAIFVVSSIVGCISSVTVIVDAFR